MWDCDYEDFGRVLRVGMLADSIDRMTVLLLAKISMVETGKEDLTICNIFTDY